MQRRRKPFSNDGSGSSFLSAEAKIDSRGASMFRSDERRLFGKDRPVRDPMLQGKEKRVGSKE
jgi:hypothetical protein